MTTDVTIDAGLITITPEIPGEGDGDGDGGGPVDPISPVTPVDPVPGVETGGVAHASGAHQASRLAFTGVEAAALLLGALTILGLGTSLTIRGARRRRATT